MKKFLLLGVIFFATLNIYAQKCGAHIDLLGIGIYSQSTATITIPDWKNVESILAEAVYKSDHVPVVFDISKDKKGSVLFYTGELNDPVQKKYALPGDPLDFSGVEPVKNIHVFRAKFDQPAPSVTLDILENAADFYSFALYVYRKDGTVYSIKAGELVHIFHNEGVEPDDKDKHDVEIEIPTSDDPRDILFRFGVTELNAEDGRLAIFKFWANGVEKSTTLESYDPEAGESYIIPELLLEDVPGPIDMITMTMLSMNPNSTDLPRGGDSFIAGVVLADFPCEKYESELLCSFTQGFYGNAGGKACGKKGTSELLYDLLAEDLVMGLAGTNDAPGNSLTIGARDVECVLRLLPGGGPSKVLVGDAHCEDQDSYESKKQGRLKNTLLAQGITLTLNTRLSPQLPEFPVDGTEFVTLMAMDCMDPEAGGVPGTEMTHAFSPEIVDALGADATIADLLQLVNDALGGADLSPMEISLSQVADAAALVNEAFDECVVVMGYAEVTPVDEDSGDPDDQEDVEKQDGKKGMTGVSDPDEEVLGIYPNPVMDHFYLDMPSGVDEVKQAAIYSLTGIKVMDIHQSVLQGAEQVIEINVSHLNEGIYFVRIETATGSVTKRFGIQ